MWSLQALGDVEELSKKKKKKKKKEKKEGDAARRPYLYPRQPLSLTLCFFSSSNSIFYQI